VFSLPPPHRAPMSEGKKVVRVVPTSYKRKVAAENRSVFEEEQKQQRHKSKIANKEEKERKRVAHAINMHRSGKARALIETGEGQQQIEVGSDEELDLPDPSALPAPEENDEETVLPKEVTLQDGSTVGIPCAIHKVLTVLKRVGGYQHIGECVLSSYCGIPVSSDANSYFKQTLSKNPLISVTQCADGGALYKAKQRVGVETKTDLLDLFRNKLPSGAVKTSGGLSAATVSEEDLKGAYAGVECDLDRMISDGEIDVLRIGTSEKTDIFFPSAPGVQAPPSVRDLWHSISVPDENTLRKSLVDAKLRTPEEFEARDKRIKDKNVEQAKIAAARKQAEKEEKNKPLVGKGIKNVHNAHIDDLF
jgi:hypothetical protein